ncbi:ArnT family glycosyltransferase [Flagellimonas meishanensis]|uniref:ArnT family glycosyltransferase n=1 Tax=Flagellimonas meishanensis TaxID=2873264 RepID=UPI001CA600BC|nr:glycosyltransferase family 39 protein [[Muricauda] meishanensis]
MPSVLKQALSFFSNNDESPKWISVFWILFLVALIIRFPFFFRDYIDRDESTFIIMGQSWVDGFLPYTHLWDLKPPVTFLFFAIIIKVFGKSFLAIRAMGVLLVALTGLFTYALASKFTSHKIAFWSAFFCVLFQSLFGSLQGVMSEHICTFFFVVGTYLLLVKEQKVWFLVAGLMFGLSVMSKLNMAYPLLCLGLYLLYDGYRQKQVKHVLGRLVPLGTGFLFIVFLTAFPYYFQNELGAWWLSIFEAPMAYSGSRLNSRLKVLPVVIFLLGLLIAGFATKLLDRKSKPLHILGVIIIGVLLSFIQAGRANGHYLIQVYPFVLIPMAIVVGKLPPVKSSYRPVMVALLMLLPMEAYLEYAHIISNKLNKGAYFNGEGIEVPNYIVQNKLETTNIFFTEYHIGYWVLGVDPPTKAATHPSNITRDELFPYMQNPRETGLDELKFIMEEIRPKTVVARKGKKIFDKKLVEYNSYIDAYLERHYTLLATVDRGLIYQRSE